MKPKLYQEHLHSRLYYKNSIQVQQKTQSCMNYRLTFDICRQTLAAIPADILEQVKAEAENYEVIGIDEGQFVS